MYILNIATAIKKMKIKDLKDFILENYYQRNGYTEESSYYSIKRQKKKKIYHSLQPN